MANEKDDIVFLQDILDSIIQIEKYVQNVAETEFENNLEKQDAVIRRLEIIGEAVKGVSQELRNQTPNLPWREMAGMRDVVIHQYFGVSISLIWRVTQKEIPILKLSIIEIIELLEER